MRQFYLNFRHIFRCNLRESWKANTVCPKPICIRNSILVFDLKIFFLNMRWVSFILIFDKFFGCNLRESWRAETVRPKPICIRNTILVFHDLIFFSNMRCVSFISILYTIFVAMSENLRKHEVPHSALHSNAKANSNSQF